MVVNFSNLDFHERPILILKNAGGTPLGVLGYANNIAGDLKYNETSSITFKLPAYVDGEPVPYYDEVIGMRTVELKGIGQFVLMSPSEINDGIKKEKSCKAYSLEYEFVYKQIALPHNTYKFFDYANPENTLLGIIMDMMPSWRVGRVSDSLINKYRTFEVSGENLYNLIKGTVQQSYNCIFDFDTMTRTVHVRDASEKAIDKPVFISLQNLAKQIEVTEDTESLKTRLDVNGAEGVSIRDVNPTGTNKIINLDYFMTTANFPQALIDKYYRWKELCEASRESYYALSVQYATKTAQKVSEQAKATDLQGELTLLENEQAVTIQSIAQGLSGQSALNTVNAQIAAKQREINAQNASVSALTHEQESIMDQLKAIASVCKFESYFTRDEQIQMDRYLMDDSISDSTFVVTEVESFENAGKGIVIDSEVLTFAGGEIKSVQNAIGGDVYEIKGGTMRLGGDMTANVISAIVDWHNDDTFVMSAYLSSGTIQGNTFPSACASVTGSGGRVPGDDTLSLLVRDGYRYFTLDASEYEKRSVAWELYEYGEEVLRKLSQPSYTFQIDSANFMALDEFESFKNSFELGQQVYIDLDDFGVLKPIAIGVQFSYGDLTKMTLQFSDRFTSNDSSFQLVDMLEKSVSMGKNLEMSKYIYSSFVDSGASTGLKEFMTSALDTAKKTIMSSTDQAISWDGAGFRLRKYANEAQTAYEPEQIWMNNNSIVMTEDGWATAEMAIGKFHDDNLGDCWGIVAPRIVGTLLAGGSLIIESAKRDGNTAVFRVDGDGCRLYNSDMTITNGSSHIVLNPDIGIAIGEYPVYSIGEDGKYTFHEDKAKFWADANGDLHFKGTLHGVNGEFTGSVTATSLTILEGSNATPIEQYVRNQTADELAGLSASVDELIDTVDGEMEIYYTSSTPYYANENDIWYNTNTGYVYRKKDGAWKDITSTTLGHSISGIKDAQATADGKITTFAQPNAPSSMSIGDLWIDTNDNNKLYRCGSSGWVEVRDGLITQAQLTAISASALAEGIWNGTTGMDFSIRNSNVSKVEINTSVGIRVTGYDGAYFQVTDTEMGFFNRYGSPMLRYYNGNMVLSGQIAATSGYIGGINGWTIGNQAIYSRGASYLGAPDGIYLGNNGISISDAITLKPDGSFIIHGDNTSSSSSNYVFKIVPETVWIGSGYATVYKMHLGNIQFGNGFVVPPEHGGTGGSDKTSAGTMIGLHRAATVSAMQNLRDVSNGDICVVYAAGSSSSSISGTLLTYASSYPGYLSVGTWSDPDRQADYFDITDITYWNIPGLSGESVSASQYARVGVGHTTGGAAGYYTPVRLSVSGAMSALTLSFSYALRPSGSSRDTCTTWQNGITIALYRGGSSIRLAQTTYMIPTSWQTASSTLRTATITLNSTSNLGTGEYYLAFFSQSVYSLMWIQHPSITISGNNVTTDDGIYIRSGNTWKMVGQAGA